MLAVLANETSAIIQFRLTKFLCYISLEEQAVVEVKIASFVGLVFTEGIPETENCDKAGNSIVHLIHRPKRLPTLHFWMLG